MASTEPQRQLTSVVHEPAGEVDDPVADRLHPLGHPARAQDQAFHQRIEIQGQDHGAPPRSVGAEELGGQLTTRQILFHDHMRFFAFATALTVPPDELLAGEIAVGHHAEELVALRP